MAQSFLCSFLLPSPRYRFEYLINLTIWKKTIVQSSIFIACKYMFFVHYIRKYLVIERSQKKVIALNFLFLQNLVNLKLT